MASRTRSLRLVEGSETAQAVLVHVDPRTLLVHPGNLRTDLGDLAELEASIAANGVVQALTLLPDGDKLSDPRRAPARRCGGGGPG